ncbi:MAG: hypothetical protein R6W94_02150, partial [Spirochaetia bacterium]
MWKIGGDAPASAVDALPSAQSESDFLVRWAGSDGEGAGVASYTVYASEDDGEFYPWLQDTELTEAMF